MLSLKSIKPTSSLLTTAVKSYSATDEDTSEFIWNLEKPSDYEKKVLKSEKPVLLHLEAAEADISKSLKPTLRKAVTSLAGRLQYVSVDIERYPQLAQQYEATAMPALFALKDQEVVSKFEGDFNSKDDITNFVTQMMMPKQII